MGGRTLLTLGDYHSDVLDDMVASWRERSWYNDV